MFKCNHGTVYADKEEAILCNLNHHLADCHNIDAKACFAAAKEGKRPSGAGVVFNMLYEADVALGIVDAKTRMLTPQSDEIVTKAPLSHMAEIAREQERRIIIHWVRNNLTILETLIGLSLDAERVMDVGQTVVEPPKDKDGKTITN